MKGITTLLFDIDGTLLDTTEFIMQAFEHTLKSHNHSAQSREAINKHMGKPLPEIYLALTESSQDLDKLKETHITFQHSNFALVKPFLNTVETLIALKKKGYRMAAVTTRSQRTSKKTLEDAGIINLFDIVVSLEDVKNPKPHPEPLLKALEHMGEKSKNAVMIGDSIYDIQAGKSAGTKTIGVLWGFHPEILSEAKPDFLISDISELLKLL